MEIPRFELFNLFVDGKDTSDLFEYVNQRIENLNVKKAKKKISFLAAKLRKNWKICGRKRGRFEEQYKLWLEASESFDVLKKSEPKQFSLTCRRTKLSRVQDLRAKYTPAEIGFANAANVTNAGNRRSGELIEKLNQNPKLVPKDKPLLKPEPYTSEEAISFIARNSFSKAQYQDIRKMLLDKNLNLLPAYNHVVAAKEKCYPSGKISFMIMLLISLKKR